MNHMIINGQYSPEDDELTEEEREKLREQEEDNKYQSNKEDKCI